MVGRGRAAAAAAESGRARAEPEDDGRPRWRPGERGVGGNSGLGCLPYGSPAGSWAGRGGAALISGRGAVLWMTPPSRRLT